MADLEKIITANYDTGAMLDRIKDGLRQIGADPEHPNVTDLKLADEFHVGGAEATEMLLTPMGITPETRVLDLGSGIGGPARYMAQNFGCHVTGIDLTPAYVETGIQLSKMTGLAEKNSFTVGSATDLPFDDESFDLVTLLHVGMNIPDKVEMFSEAARTLAPGGRFLVFDVMAMADTPLSYPMPWAAVAEGSFVESPTTYKRLGADAGLTLQKETNHAPFALDFFRRVAENVEKNGRPAVGLHLIMGDSGPERLRNYAGAIGNGLVAPTEMIFHKAGGV